MIAIGKSEKVRNFIDELETLDPNKYEIVTRLYALFVATKRDFTDKFIYGGIGIYIGEELIGGIWVYTNHVSLVLGDGYKLKDTYGVLEGGGKFRRHIKLLTTKDIEDKKCSEYIKAWFDL